MGIETLIVNLSGNGYQDPKLKEIEINYLTSLVIEEIGIAKVKCSKINKIQGQVVDITELRLTGQTEISQVEIGYLNQDKMEYRKYSINDFYKLK